MKSLYEEQIKHFENDQVNVPFEEVVHG